MSSCRHAPAGGGNLENWSNEEKMKGRFPSGFLHIYRYHHHQDHLHHHKHHHYHCHDHHQHDQDQNGVITRCILSLRFAKWIRLLFHCTGVIITIVIIVNVVIIFMIIIITVTIANTISRCKKNETKLGVFAS